MPETRTITHFVHHLERDDDPLRQTTIALVEHYRIAPGLPTERFTLEITDQARDFSDEKPVQSIPLTTLRAAQLAESFASAAAEMIRRET